MVIYVDSDCGTFQTGSDVSLYVVSEDFLDTWRRFVRSVVFSSLMV